ncbi:PRC-barrel domain-containing protein [Methylobacterium sp. A54F]
MLVALSAPALAQEAPVGQAGRDDGRAQILAEAPPGATRVGKLIGLPVIGMDRVRVGKIDDVILDREGRIAAVVIGVGGLLGLGEKAVAVSYAGIAWNRRDVPLTGLAGGKAPDQAAADRTGPDKLPGGQITDEALAAVENRHSDRVTDATGSTAAREPPAQPATVAAGGEPVEAEIRLTKADLQAAPAFRFGAEDGAR